MSNVRKIIDFLEKDAPKSIKKVPNYNEESIAFKRNKNFDPCRENPKICSNNGVCVPKDGNFYCLCPRTHYGKTCEHIADLTNCEKNLCQNNSTCVSVDLKRKVINIPLLEEIKKKKSVDDELTDDELKSIDIEIEYDCICRPGFYGVICEISEELKRCEEEYCLGRGQGKIENGTCKCDCDKQYFGQRCEQISACFDSHCENGGKCEDQIDEENKTIKAVCHCPQNIEMFNGTVRGENCEQIEIFNDADPELLPCSTLNNSNSFRFFTKLINKLDRNRFESDIKELSKIRDSYDNGHSIMGEMNNGWCENGGKCVPEVILTKTKRSFFIHRCECSDPLTDGHYCEYKREDACSLTREEKNRGLAWDSRCTDIAHGACLVVFDKPKCVCKPDYTGTNCEVFDPCARNPCKHGNCIPIPDTSELSLTSAKYQCLCPLSAQLEHGTECVKIEEGACQSNSCGNGRCVPCETNSEDDLMPLCNIAEQKKGFRCLCEAGFMPPSCRTHTNPCFQNLCKNSASCVPDFQYKTYECRCLNGTSGTLCENLENACEAFGQNVCKNGICINDEYYHRGFSCECYHSFRGINCDFQITFIEEIWSEIEAYYQITIPLIFCSICLIIILFVVCPNRK